MFKLNFKIDKKWLENYWYYYKNHTIAGIFIIIILAYSLVECSHKVYPDLTVSYIGENTFNQEVVNKLIEKFSESVDDVTANGKKEVDFNPLTIEKEAKSEQDLAMVQKAQLEIAVGESYLYIMDKPYYEKYVKEGLFLNLAEELGKSGEVYGVSLNNNSFFSSLGLKNNMDLYVGVRVITNGNEKKPMEIAKQNNAIKVLKEFVK